MQIARPTIAFGKGFINSIPSRNASAALFQVDVSTGMPIVSHKKPVLSEKGKIKLKNFVQK
jgi:hypothetical protein